MKIFKSKVWRLFLYLIVFFLIILAVYTLLDIILISKLNKNLEQVVNYQKAISDIREADNLMYRVDVRTIQHVIGRHETKIDNILSNYISLELKLKYVRNEHPLLDNDVKDILFKIELNLLELKNMLSTNNSDMVAYVSLLNNTTKHFEDVSTLIELSYKKSLKSLEKKQFYNRLLRVSTIFYTLLLAYFTYLFSRVSKRRVGKVKDVFLNTQDYISKRKVYGYNDEYTILINSYLETYAENANKTKEIIYLQDYYNEIIESMPSIIVSLTDKLKVFMYNKKFRQIFEFDMPELKGMHIFDLVPELKKYNDSLQKTIYKKEIIHIDGVTFSKDSSTYSIILFPVKKSEQYSVVLRIDDITELSKKNRQLQQAQKMESVGTLASGLAHNFNNILGGIVATISILQFKMKEEDFKLDLLEKQLALMQDLSERATDLVKQLLSLSRTKEACLVRLDLNSAIKRVYKICKNTFDKSIEFSIEIYNIPRYIIGDISLIDQILLNLMINASHALTIMKSEGEKWGGTISVKIAEREVTLPGSIASGKQNLFWVLSISDNGIGIAKDKIGKIFDPFYTTKDKEYGTGLGLSMVYSIMSQHNGQIEVESELGVGTTFNLIFPVFDKDSSIEYGSDHTTLVQGSGNILLLDDDNAINTITKSILNECGYVVTSFTESELALKEYMEKEPQFYDLLLVDLIMPKMSGFEFCIKVLERNINEKILLSSGYHNDQRIKKLLDLGVKSFIAKPYTMQDLSQKISDIITNKRESYVKL